MRLPMVFSTTISDQAIIHFDREASNLLTFLKPIPPKPRSPTPIGSQAHVPISAHLTDNDIRSPINVSYRDWLGGFKGFEIHDGTIHETLSEEAVIGFERLVDTVVQHQNLPSFCSANYVREHLINWIRQRRLGQPIEVSWVAALLKQLAHAVVEQCILVPVVGIQISDRFKLGRVEFDFFRESSIADMTRFIPEGTPILAEFRERMKKTYQGCVYAEYKCVAEKTHAEQSAIYHTEKALDLLRMFELAAQDIRARSVLGRMGDVAPMQRHTFTVGSTGELFLSDGLEREGCIDFILDSELWSLLRNSQIYIANDLLQKDKLSDLEKNCLEALSHFAHGIRSHAPQDRLLHAMVAVESLLLRDGNEPVQSKLGYRIALLTARDLESRRRAQRAFLDGYVLRSRFVHHGARPTEIETANQCLRLCWDTVGAVFKSSQHFTDKKALLDRLEDEILSPRR